MIRQQPDKSPDGLGRPYISQENYRKIKDYGKMRMAILLALGVMLIVAGLIPANSLQANEARQQSKPAASIINDPTDSPVHCELFNSEIAVRSGNATTASQNGNSVIRQSTKAPLNTPPTTIDQNVITVTAQNEKSTVVDTPVPMMAITPSSASPPPPRGSPPPPPPPPAPMASAPPPPGGVLSQPAPISRPPGYDQNRERYQGEEVASIIRVAEQPVSTFSIDVDTGSYSNVRRMLNAGQRPPQDAVRSEELINYFRYDYSNPTDKSQPFSLASNIAQTPWNGESRLLRIGLRAWDVASAARPAANLVFLVDVSGSMYSSDKLPLVKATLSGLTDQLRADDRVSIVVYSGNTGLLLEPTSEKKYIQQALDCMQSGGSTAGGEALKLAYSTARANYDENRINRILLATDGDFNVGVTDTDQIIEMVERERKSGVTLTTLGYGTGNYNEALMERIADAGNGNYAYIDSAQEAKKVLSDQLSATLYTIASDVKIQIEFDPTYVREYRLIGYENRLLAEEDFDNDTVDAGEIGAGHQVTALYEIIPADNEGWLPERRYPANQNDKDRQSDRANQAQLNGEFGYLKLRYKLPGEDQSRLIEQPLAANMLADARAPTGDMAFVAAVAAYGQILRGDKYMNGFTMAKARSLAGKQNDYWRQEFLQLTELAERN